MARNEERNAELMQTLDDAWNAQDVDVFMARHKPDVVVCWPGQPEPTRGLDDHLTESKCSGKPFRTSISTTGRIGSSSPPATTPARSRAVRAFDETEGGVARSAENRETGTVSKHVSTRAPEGYDSWSS
jgi:hypothetical protein